MKSGRGVEIFIPKDVGHSDRVEIFLTTGLQKRPKIKTKGRSVKKFIVLKIKTDFSSD